MQRITLEELKHILYHAFRDHLTMKDIENIIINEEESLNENSGNCQTEFEGERESPGVSVQFSSSRVCKTRPDPGQGCVGLAGRYFGVRSKDTQRAQELPSVFFYPSAKPVLFQAQG